MKRRVFGFDLGIASIGWAVVDFDNEYYDMDTGEILEEKVKGSGEIAQGKIVACGVRSFPVAENPKDGSSLAAARRECRLSRRTCRRKARRKEGLRCLFAAKGLVDNAETFTEEICKQQIGGDVWNLRVKALSEKLSKEELARVLYHLAKHRGFKSARKAEEESDKKDGKKVLSAIRANMALKEDGKSLAQIIVERAKVDEYKKMRNSSADYRNSIPRSEIEAELEMIFAKQKEYGIFTQDLYDDFKRIAFRQRGIKSVGDMVGNCTFEKGEKRAPKEAPASEFFVAWSKINNLAVYEGDKKRFLTTEERQALFELLKTTKDVKYKTIRAKLFKGKDIQFACLNYTQQKMNKKGELADPEDVSFYNMKGWHKLQSAFKAMPEIFSDIEKLDKAVTIIATEKEDTKIQEKLVQLGYSQEKIDKFLTLSFDKFINLSLKALYKINPYLEQGEKYDKACASAGYNFKETEKLAENKGRLLPVLAGDKLPKSPVVKRAIAQYRKLFNALEREYGVPDQVNIETGRELKKSFEERREIQKRQQENRDRNESVKKQIKEMGVQATGTNITKLRLYYEQQGKSIYNVNSKDNDIKIERLFEIGYAEIDHILPYSRSFDNSYTNKVLVLAKENQEKGNKTPFEYLGKHNANSQEWLNFISYVTSIQSMARSKKEKLLNETFYEREQEFRDRNINDNNYIAMFVKRYVEDCIDFSQSLHTNIKNKVQVRSGNVTAFLRHQWGLEKNRAESDKHHAQDAIVIACATQGMVQALSKISRKEGRVHTKAVHEKYAIAQPWDTFRNDVLSALENVFVSRSPRKKATGELHKETIEKKTNNPIKVELRGGEVTKANMFRYDVYKVGEEYKIVPLYVMDLIRKDFKHYFQPVEEKPVEADPKDFLFSLYKDSYVEIKTKEECFVGYISQYNAQSGQIYLESSDRSKIYKIRDKKELLLGYRLENEKKVNISVIQELVKYEVSILGEKNRVTQEQERFFQQHKKIYKK